MRQDHTAWDCGTTGLGVLVSDSLMFERGAPSGSNPRMSHFYGMALPLLTRGLPVTPVQLENVTAPNYLDGFRVLLLSYVGMKPLSPEVHAPLVQWVRNGGVLVVCDDDGDPFNHVREWWNTGGRNYATPRQHLFEQLGWPKDTAGPPANGDLEPVGKGGVIWLRESPVRSAESVESEGRLVEAARIGAKKAGVDWRETNYLMLRRGPYVIAAGLDESVGGESKTISGRFVNLFDPDLQVRKEAKLDPGTRWFLLDLDAEQGAEPRVLASACRSLATRRDDGSLLIRVEGVGETPAVVLARADRAPKSVTIEGQTLTTVQYSAEERLLWVRFVNQSRPRELLIKF
jgi:hypothetical protein